jgi:hypothetical protein
MRNDRFDNFNSERDIPRMEFGGAIRRKHIHLDLAILQSNARSH